MMKRWKEQNGLPALLKNKEFKRWSGEGVNVKKPGSLKCEYAVHVLVSQFQLHATHPVLETELRKTCTCTGITAKAVDRDAQVNPCTCESMYVHAS